MLVGSEHLVLEVGGPEQCGHHCDQVERVDKHGDELGRSHLKGVESEHNSLSEQSGEVEDPDPLSKIHEYEQGEAQHCRLP